MPNLVIQSARKHYPEYSNLTDDELTLEYASQFPEFLKEDDFKRDYDRITGNVEAPASPRPQQAGYGRIAGQSFISGTQRIVGGIDKLGETVLSLPETLGLSEFDTVNPSARQRWASYYRDKSIAHELEARQRDEALNIVDSDPSALFPSAGTVVAGAAEAVPGVLSIFAPALAGLRAEQGLALGSRLLSRLFSSAAARTVAAEAVTAAAARPAAVIAAEAAAKAAANSSYARTSGLSTIFGNALGGKMIENREFYEGQAPEGSTESERRLAGMRGGIGPGVVHAAIELGMSRLGMKYGPEALLGARVADPIKRSFIATVARHMGFEATEEALTSVLQLSSDKVTSRPDLTFPEAVKEVILSGAVGGLLGVGSGAISGAVAPSASADTTGRDANAAYFAEQDSAMIAKRAADMAQTQATDAAIAAKKARDATSEADAVAFLRAKAVADASEGESRASAKERNAVIRANDAAARAAIVDDGVDPFARALPKPSAIAASDPVEQYRLTPWALKVEALKAQLIRDAARPAPAPLVNTANQALYPFLGVKPVYAPAPVVQPVSPVVSPAPVAFTPVAAPVTTIPAAKTGAQGEPVEQMTPEQSAATAKLRKTDGWKLHLNVSEDANDPLTQAISKTLTALGVNFKVGRSGGQAGKGMTIYVGSKDAAVAIAARLENEHTLPAGINLPEDARWSQGVNARFDISANPDFHQYGFGGTPVLNQDVQAAWGQPGFGFTAANASKADRALAKLYGSFYTGTFAPAPTPKPSRAAQASLSRDQLISRSKAGSKALLAAKASSDSAQFSSELLYENWQKSRAIVNPRLRAIAMAEAEAAIKANAEKLAAEQQAESSYLAKGEKGPFTAEESIRRDMELSKLRIAKEERDAANLQADVLNRESAERRRLKSLSALASTTPAAKATTTPAPKPAGPYDSYLNDFLTRYFRFRVSNGRMPTRELEQSRFSGMYDWFRNEQLKAGVTLPLKFEAPATRVSNRLPDLDPEASRDDIEAKSFRIVPVGRGDFDGMRADYGKATILNTEPGNPGWLGNPDIASDVRGGTLTREQAVNKFKATFLSKIKNDAKFRDAVLALRGKSVGYYKPSEANHLNVVQDWLAAQTGVAPGENIASASRGGSELGQALTNVTYGKFQITKPDLVAGLVKAGLKKPTGGQSAEHWYQANKSARLDPNQDSRDMAVMQRIIKAKLNQYPELVRAITSRGGSAWLLSSNHTVFSSPRSRPSGFSWEGSGRDSGFINALNEAYTNVVASLTIQSQPAAATQIQPIAYDLTTAGRQLRELHRVFVSSFNRLEPEVRVSTKRGQAPLITAAWAEARAHMFKKYGVSYPAAISPEVEALIPPPYPRIESSLPEPDIENISDTESERDAIIRDVDALRKAWISARNDRTLAKKRELFEQKVEAISQRVKSVRASFVRIKTEQASFLIKPQDYSEADDAARDEYDATYLDDPANRRESDVSDEYDDPNAAGYQRDPNSVGEHRERRTEKLGDINPVTLSRVLNDIEGFYERIYSMNRDGSWSESESVRNTYQGKVDSLIKRFTIKEYAKSLPVSMEPMVSSLRKWLKMTPDQRVAAKKKAEEKAKPDADADASLLALAESTERNLLRAKGAEAQSVADELASMYRTKLRSDQEAGVAPSVKQGRADFSAWVKRTADYMVTRGNSETAQHFEEFSTGDISSEMAAKANFMSFLNEVISIYEPAERDGSLSSEDSDKLTVARDAASKIEDSFLVRFENRYSLAAPTADGIVPVPFDSSLEAGLRQQVVQSGTVAQVQIVHLPNSPHVEGWADPSSFIVYLNTSAPSMLDANNVQRVIREETAHALLSSVPGQSMVSQSFGDLSRSDVALLQSQGYAQFPGESASSYALRLKDEFIAKHARQQTTRWKGLVQYVKQVLDSLGIRSLTNSETAVMILKSLSVRGSASTSALSLTSTVGGVGALSRYLTPTEGLGSKYRDIIDRGLSTIDAAKREIADAQRVVEDAVVADFGVSYDKLSIEDRLSMLRVLQRPGIAILSLPNGNPASATLDALYAARDTMTRLSARFGSASRSYIAPSLSDVIDGNPNYLTRTYRLFEDAGWMDNLSAVINSGSNPEITSAYREALRAAAEDLNLAGEQPTYANSVSEVERQLVTLRDKEQSAKSTSVGGLAGGQSSSVNVPSYMRVLMGEVKDPIEVIGATMSNLSGKIAFYDTLHTFVGHAQSDGLISKGRGANRNNEHTVSLKVDDATDPLSDYYTTPDFHKHVIELRAKSKESSALLDTLASITRVSKLMQTGGNLGFTAQQVFGNMVSLIQAGHFTSALGLPKGVYDVLRDRYGRTPLATREAYTKLVKLGLLNNNQLNPITKNRIADAANGVSLSEQLDGVNKLKGGVDELLKILSSVDNAAKAIAFYAEVDAITSGYSKAPASERPSAGAIEELAAARVKERLPSYTRVPLVLKNLDYVPMAGNFTIFAYLSSYNLVKNVQYTMLDLKNPYMRSHGLKSLAGLATTAAIASSVMSSLLGSLLGEADDDEKEEFLRAKKPFNKETRWVVYKDSNGRINGFTLDSLDPMSNMSKATSALYKGVATEAGFVDSVLGAVGQVFAPLLQEGKLSKVWGDVLDGEDSFHNRIWQEGDDNLTKMSKGILHIGKQLYTPSSFRKFVDEIHPAMTSGAAERGRSAAWEMLVVGELTASKPQQLNRKQAALAEMRQLMAQYRKLGAESTRYIMSRDNLTQAQADIHYDNFLAKREKAFNEASISFRRLVKNGGFTDAQVRQIADEADFGIASSRALMSGVYVKPKFSLENQRDLERINQARRYSDKSANPLPTNILLQRRMIEIKAPRDRAYGTYRNLER